LDYLERKEFAGLPQQIRENGNPYKFNKGGGKALGYLGHKKM
jgi:hypothetical protein